MQLVISFASICEKTAEVIETLRTYGCRLSTLRLPDYSVKIEIEEKLPMWARRSSMFWTLHWVMYIFEEWTRWECLNMPHIHDPHAHGLIRSNNSWIRPWYNWHTFHEQSFYFFKMCKSTLWLFYWVESFEWFVMKISCYEADQYLKKNIVHPISAAHLPNIPVNFQQCQSIANAYVLNYQHLFGAKIGRI